MNRGLLAAGLVGLAVVGASATTLDLIHDNYLGKPESVDPTWNLPYDAVRGLSSERATIVPQSWTADDMVIPEGPQDDLLYFASQVKWIGLVQLPTGAQLTGVDVAFYLANPDPEGNPIISDPFASFTGLAMDSFVSLNDTVIINNAPWDVYEGTITLPEDVLLPAGHIYYTVRAVGNGLGRHMIATTGGDAQFPEQNIFGGLEQGAFQSPFFSYPERPNWADCDHVMQIPNPNGEGTIAYASDFAYQVYGHIIPEPTSLVLLLLAGLSLWRRH